MGNIDAKRDWGHAKDYVEMQWLMLQQEAPEDFVIASGKQYSVREFIIWAASAIGLEVQFTGSGIREIGIVTKITGDQAPKVSIGQEIVKIDPKFYRPAEVESLLGDPSKAKTKLGWQPKLTAKELCFEMMENDIKFAKQRAIMDEADKT